MCASVPLRVFVCLCVPICVSVCTFVCVCLYVPVCICVCVFLYVCLCVYVCPCVYLCLCAFVYVYVSIYTCVYMCLCVLLCVCVYLCVCVNLKGLTLLFLDNWHLNNSERDTIQRKLNGKWATDASSHYQIVCSGSERSQTWLHPNHGDLDISTNSFFTSALQNEF